MAEMTFEQQIEHAAKENWPMLKPIPLLDDSARSERVSTYLELPLLRFLERYRVRMGARSMSEVLRRLAILGAISEGFVFQEAQN